MKDKNAEEKAVRDAERFLRNCAWTFVEEKGMSPSIWLDDVYQEAIISFILFRRGAEEGNYGGNPENYGFAQRFIFYHLMRKFHDFKGIHATYYATCRQPPPKVVSRSSSDRDSDSPDMSCCRDWDYPIYLRDWLNTLKEHDRRVVMLLLKGYTPGEVIRRLNIPAQTYYTRRQHIRKSYEEYFNVA